MMVRDFQSVIGRETREQMQEAEGRLPDSLVACIGGGSNAMGLFHPFLDDRAIEIYGVEAAGHGLDTGMHAASIAGGRPGVLHGNRTYLLMDDDGQINEAHSISAGLDYPGIGPEHAWLNDIGRVTYLSATDDEALDAFQLAVEARRHHSGARAGACHRQGARARAEEAEGSPDGGQSLRPRRQGPRYRGASICESRSAMTTRIDRALRRARSATGRAALVTFLMAGDPDSATSLAILKALPQGRRRRHRARHAVYRSDGRRSGDPGGGPARAAGRAEHEEDARAGARLPRGDDATPIVLMGYYNPIYIYGVDQFLADAKAAGVDGLIVVDLPPEEDTELCLPALQGRAQFHPAGDADHRRQAAAGGARQHLGLCLLRLDHRHHRRRRAGCRRRSREAVARIKRHTRLPVCVGFGVRTAEQAARASRAAPTASWSARRWSRRCAQVSTPTARPPGKPWRRSADWSARWPKASARRASRPLPPTSVPIGLKAAAAD